MTYQEYDKPVAGWKGVIFDAADKPYIWVAVDGSWIFDKDINRGPFHGDIETMRRYMRAEGFLCGEAKCLACGNEWNAIVENESANGSLECPKCGAKRGIILGNNNEWEKL